LSFITSQSRDAQTGEELGTCAGLVGFINTVLRLKDNASKEASLAAFSTYTAGGINAQVILESFSEDSTPAEVTPQSNPGEKLFSMTGTYQHESRNLIRTIVSDVTGKPAVEIATDEDFTKLVGGDPLKLREITVRLVDIFGPLSCSLLDHRSTVQSLADYFTKAFERGIRSLMARSGPNFINEAQTRPKGDKAAIIKFRKQS
jgi:acyl carrier protein